MKNIIILQTIYPFVSSTSPYHISTLIGCGLVLLIYNEKIALQISEMIFLFSFSIFSNYLKLFEKVICCDLTCRILPSYQHAMNIENPFEAQSNLISSYCFFFIFIMILTTIILLLHFHWLYQEILHFSKQSSLLIPTPTIKLRKHFLGKYHD